MAISKQDIAALIIDHVQKAVKTKAVGEDYEESMEVVIGCLSDAFEVDAEKSSQIVTEKFNGKDLTNLVESGLASSSSSVPIFEKPQEEDSASSVPVKISSDEAPIDKEKAEGLKAQGNKLMASKDFKGAIEKYSEAIEADGTNAIYYSNRAAAYSSFGKHNLAIKDANKAIELDPKYARGYSRLGLANYALGDAKAALAAYEKGLEIEGDKASAGMLKGYETAKKRVQEETKVAASSSSPPSDNNTRSAGSSPASGMPDLGNLASMLGGAGGAGGMPDLGSLMNNPQIMQAAQQMMSDPSALSNLMNNPMMQQMAQNFGLGGGAGADSGSEGGASGSEPNLNDLMNNPMLRDMANQFMGGRNGGQSGNN